MLPWATLTTAFGSIEVSGMDGDGKVALALAVLAGLATMTGNEGSMVVLGLLGGILMGYEWSNVSDKVGGLSDSTAHASVGSGIYAGLIGFVVVFVAGAMGDDEPAGLPNEPTWTP